MPVGVGTMAAASVGSAKGACPTGCRAYIAARYPLIVDSSRELGGHAASIGRVAADTIHAIHILHKCGIDAAVARPLTPSIQAEQAFVSKTEESGVDPLVHGLKHGDVRNSGRWAKVAPLHAGSYDAHDVVVSFVEA